jgi:hypothetical protein
MAGLNCDLLFSYTNRKEYVGVLNFRNVIAMQVQRVFDASAGVGTGFSGVPSLITGGYTGLVVNGVDFGSGRITAFSNPTSTDIRENGRHLWKQVVSFEFYQSGDSGNLSGFFSGLNSGYISNLQAFDEQFSFEMSPDGDYQYSHSASIKCVDDITGATSGYIFAQRIASGLLASTPPFGYIDVVHSGFYTGAVGRRIYSETVSIFDGAVSFEEKFAIQSRDFLKHAVAFENGFMNITETLMMRHSGVSTVSGAMTNNEFNINTRYSTNFAGAYTRCNSLYSTYNTVMGTDVYASNLSTQPLQITKVFDERAQELTYTVVYTNNPNMSPSGYTLDREQVITENSAGTVQAVENATLTAFNSKDSSLQTMLISGVNGELSGVQTRFSPYYSNINNLKKESEAKTISAFGKKGSYTVSFTSDASLYNDGTFLTKTFNIQDNLPIRIHTPYLIIGRATPLVHNPGQTELGTVVCSVAAILVRPTGFSPNSPYKPLSVLNQLFTEALNKALLTASTKSPTDTFATKVSYEYDSNLNIQATVELQYLYPRETNI